MRHDQARRPTIGQFSFLFLMLAATPAAAQHANPTLVADPKTGCKVWDLYYDPADSISWSGPCVDGLAEGNGVLRWSVGGKPFMRFEGGYHVGKETGHGVSAWVNGSRFDGEFRGGLPNGTGTYTVGKRVYTGNWINGCFRQGTRTAAAHTTLQDCGF